MKIKYLSIDGYKNLHNVEFFFEEGSTVNAIIGNNGSGKSNVLEALTIIFAAKYNNIPVPNSTPSLNPVLETAATNPKSFFSKLFSFT